VVLGCLGLLVAAATGGLIWRHVRKGKGKGPKNPPPGMPPPPQSRPSQSWPPQPGPPGASYGGTVPPASPFAPGGQTRPYPGRQLPPGQDRYWTPSEPPRPGQPPSGPDSRPTWNPNQPNGGAGGPRRPK
jgi:hypothetical protein